MADRKIVIFDPSSGFLTDGITNGDQFDASGKPITHVGSPVDLTDATPKSYVDYNFLLDNEPTLSNMSYVPTYAGKAVINETWRTAGGALIRTVDYSYAGSRVSGEVRKVFDATGMSVVAQATWTYSYTNGRLASAAVTRDV